MRRIRTWLSWNRRHRDVERGSRSLRSIQALGADERLLLVVFLVVFTIGTILAVTETLQVHSLFPPASSTLLP